MGRRANRRGLCGPGDVLVSAETVTRPRRRSRATGTSRWRSGCSSAWRPRRLPAATGRVRIGVAPGRREGRRVREPLRCRPRSSRQQPRTADGRAARLYALHDELFGIAHRRTRSRWTTSSPRSRRAPRPARPRRPAAEGPRRLGRRGKSRGAGRRRRRVDLVVSRRSASSRLTRRRADARERHEPVAARPHGANDARQRVRVNRAAVARGAEVHQDVLFRHEPVEHACAAPATVCEARPSQPHVSTVQRTDA